MTYDEAPPRLPRINLTWVVGDTWLSEEWAVWIQGAAVDLTAPGWLVRAQVRDDARDITPVLAEWSSLTVDPDDLGQILIGSVMMEMPDGGPAVTTSTVRLAHSPTVSRRWGPIAGVIDMEATRRPVPDPDPAAAPVENYTLCRGRVAAMLDVTR